MKSVVIRRRKSILISRAKHDRMMDIAPRRLAWLFSRAVDTSWGLSGPCFYFIP